MDVLDFETPEQAESILDTTHLAESFLRQSRTPKKSIQTSRGFCHLSSEEILRTFNTWAFKREHPDSLRTIDAAIAKSLRRQQPIPFVLYWGKGPRREQAQPDVKCLSFLNDLAERVGQAYEQGASFTLIFTDTHAELNGFPADETQQYFSEVAHTALFHNFKSCFLGDLVRAFDAPKSAPAAPTPEMLSKLSLCASKWYQGEGSPGLAAEKYYTMNMIEKRAVEAAFPDCIFVTFNGSEMRELFPDNLPIFYMYSLKRGTSVKPWFLPAFADSIAEAK